MGVQLILTHENTDFDALASQLAAWKLHPQALPVLPRHPNRNIRDFLTLYGEELPFLRYEDLPRRMEVERIILVDGQTLVTPRGMTDDTIVQILDHHPLGRELPPRWSYAGGDTGSTTAMLVEKIIASGMSLSPVEATVLALGIYEDTGSLAYPTTTVRDLRCVTWLAENGANLSVVGVFLHPPLTPKQLDLYEALLDTAEVHHFAGKTVVVATAAGQGNVEEISTLAHKIRDLYDPSGLFLLVHLGDHLQVVARSTTHEVDVGHIAKHLGGGGHTRAAAALIRSEPLDSVKARLLELLGRHIRPTVTVAQIMSHGVHTLPVNTTVDQAAEAMLKYGFEGFPVVDDSDQIVGILSRREIDRAGRLRLGDMPVSQTMTKGSIFVSPDDPLERLQTVMTEFGVGQVPVVRDGQVIGVVTRTDLFKLWSSPPRQPSRREIVQKIEAALPNPLLDLLRQASDLAQELGAPLYVVGGFVRDLLSGKPTLDMDLVVEGDAIRLARRLARRVGARSRSHQRFGTAKVILEGREVEFGVASLDFAAARIEFYAHSAALPEVEQSSIKADLHRRDFTINTLAIRLDAGHYGELLDFYGGEQDLKNGIIRALHSLSFIEDPTRIMRAARFEQRLGFDIEPRTAELIDNARPMLSRVSGERIRHELYLILREREPERVLRRLDGLNVLSLIHPRLVCLESMCDLFEGLRRAIAGGQWPVPTEEGQRPAPGLYLALLTQHLARAELEALASRLKIYRDDLHLLHQVLDLRELASELERPGLANSELHGLLRHTSTAALLIGWLCSDAEPVKGRLWRQAMELRQVEPVVNGAYLKSLGLRPSPLFSSLLHAVRDARLDGRVHTEADEKALIAALLAEREQHRDPALQGGEPHRHPTGQAMEDL